MSASIASAMIVSDGCLLLTRRRQREGSLLWALPGGEIEDGRTASEAAAREVAEEAGLTVAARHVLGGAGPPGDKAAHDLRGVRRDHRYCGGDRSRRTGRCGVGAHPRHSPVCAVRAVRAGARVSRRRYCHRR